MSRGLLEIRGLNAFYDGVQALFDVNISVSTGQVTAILGANGAGKTTLFRSILSEVDIQGEIFLAGRSIRNWDTDRIVRSGVSYVPEGRGIIKYLTVEENLRVAGFANPDRKGERQNLELAYEYFPDLRSKRHDAAGTLSGGQQQMLALARVLQAGPSLLLLDEPSMGLGPKMVTEIFKILSHFCNENGVSILLNEQNVKLALGLAQNVYLLDAGRVVKDGVVADFENDENLRKTYLGY